MTVATAVWLKDLLPYTPGVVRKVATRELVLTAREFYRESAAWLAVVEDYSFDEGTHTYTVTSPDSSANILQIVSVETTTRTLDKVVERPTGERQTGTPTAWYSDTPTTFTVWPTPDQDIDDLVVRVTLTLKDTATVLPDAAYTKHYNAILDGTLGRLFAHPGKPYSSPQLAEYHLRRFRTGIAEAAAERKGGGTAGQNWRFPAYGK